MSQNKLEEQMKQAIINNAWDNGNSYCFYHEREESSEGELVAAADACAAIALDLPVKFAEWINKEVTINTYTHSTVYWYKKQGYTLKQLYQYWIENVLKIE